MAQLLLLNIDISNHLYRGDCLNVLDLIADDSVDLIYIDPPFYSQRFYETIWGEAEERFAFEDRWKGGIQTYLNYLVERVRKMHAKLKPGGSFFLHLDWHICHYMKIELDKIFDYHAFQNEVIWSYRRWPSPSSHFQRMHDNILFYAKGGKPNTFNVEYEANSPSYQKRFGGKTQMLDPETRSRKITLKTASKGLPRRDVWEISIVAGSSKERIGYPTQKPVALLERIIQASSNEGDVILDPFCGCGTAIEVAEKLGRSWIGIDITHIAITLIRNRLKEAFKDAVFPYELKSVPKDFASAEALARQDRYQFQMWALDLVNA